ncbi:SagB family peptide dehydrogenase [Streptomyces sp. NPDC020379]|uniref:SagB family peptide dehydrogenase n=1 Tax=Streptomyces sp. NPDC020379 TaxID=3365071 RepID=UPI0037A0A82F
MGIAHDYLHAVMRRGRVEMPPVGFQPDWADKPRAGKFYPGTDRLPLPRGNYPADATVDAGLAPPRPGPGARVSLDALGGMLLDSYGLLSRRLALHANDDLASLPRYAAASWARGTASGGGLYPVSVYWVNGRESPLTPGVYAYDPPHHALRRLLTGDVSGHVREALNLPSLPADTGQFLVLGIKFWQNAFKYNSFCYHATTMDIGTLTQTWRMWARARGMTVEPAFWFDEQRLNHLLGTDPDDEGVLAVVPLLSGPLPDTAAPTGTPRVRRADQERSRHVQVFPTVRAVHRATLEGAARRPDARALAAAAAPPAVTDDQHEIALPGPAPLTATVRDALRSRRSAFGRFTSAAPLRTAELAAVLRAAASGAALPCDVSPPGKGLALAGTYVFVNHVNGLEAGAYAYVPETACLRRVVSGPHGTFLQRTYFLRNYNLEQAGAVVLTTVRTGAVLDAVGDRGYRVANAVAGAASQAMYTACAALGIGCGSVLGFDNLSYIERLDLTATGECPLLLTMVGHERPGPAAFRYEIV